MLNTLFESIIALPLWVQLSGVAAVGLYTMMVLWVHYLAIMALKRQRDKGKLTKTALAFATPILVVGLVLDVFFNLVFGSILFFPDFPRELLFTDRLQRHLEQSDGRRLKIAKWFCRHFLDPFDPDGKHC